MKSRVVFRMIKLAIAKTFRPWLDSFESQLDIKTKFTKMFPLKFIYLFYLHNILRG